MIESAIYLESLRIEDKFTHSLGAWELAQAFKQNRDAALVVRNRLVKELAVYRPYLRQHPFNKYFMMVDERSQRVNELDKFLNFTRNIGVGSNKITQDDIERAKLVPIESLYSFTGHGKNKICPFHNEKTGSFHIYKNTNRYKCFGCGVSGDAIAFLMELEGLSFVEAVERLRG